MLDDLEFENDETEDVTESSPHELSKRNRGTGSIKLARCPREGGTVNS